MPTGKNKKNPQKIFSLDKEPEKGNLARKEVFRQ